MMKLITKYYRLVCNTKGDWDVLLEDVASKYKERIEDNNTGWFKVPMGDGRGYLEFSNFHLAQVGISAYNDNTIKSIKEEVEHDLSKHLVEAEHYN